MTKRIDDGKGGNIKVPAIIGHRNVPIKIIPFEELQTKLKKHKRLKVFAHKGTKCTVPGCNEEGVYIILTRDNGGSYHIDLYTKDFKLMTVDHRIPKSKGGSNKLENLFPMCTEHNSLKSDKPHIP